MQCWPKSQLESVMAMYELITVLERKEKVSYFVFVFVFLKGGSFRVHATGSVWMLLPVILFIQRILQREKPKLVLKAV